MEWLMRSSYLCTQSYEIMNKNLSTISECPSNLLKITKKYTENEYHITIYCYEGYDFSRRKTHHHIKVVYLIPSFSPLLYVQNYVNYNYVDSFIKMSKEEWQQNSSLYYMNNTLFAVYVEHMEYLKGIKHKPKPLLYHI